MNKGYIYIITYITNGKFYVGQTRSYGYNNKKIGVINRWKQHVYNACTQKINDCPKLNRAILKHGYDNFIIETLKICDIVKLNYYEKYYIRLYNSCNNGYNCIMGGDYPNFSIKQRIKINNIISIKSKNRWSNNDFKNKISHKISNTNKLKMWDNNVRQIC